MLAEKTTESYIRFKSIDIPDIFNVKNVKLSFKIIAYDLQNNSVIEEEIDQVNL